MDVAHCTLDNISYTSEEFSRLDPAQIGEKRRFLACPECGGPAFFRKQTRNGRAACFGARPHEPNCPLSALDETRIIQGQMEFADIINNPGERIIVDLDYGAHEHIHVDAHAGNIRGGVRGGAHVGGYAENNAYMHRRLSTLLRTLISSPNFKNSQQTLEILGHEIEVRNFFVPLLEIGNQHLNLLRGFWGMLSDVAVGQPGTIWLNSGGRGNISFCIDDPLFQEMCNRYGTTDAEDFSGAYVLVIGEARVSQNGKIYCSVEDQNRICIRLT